MQIETKRSANKKVASTPLIPGPPRQANGRFLKTGEQSNPKKPAPEKTQAEIVAAIRKNVETKLKKDAKASLGDYIRLVQLQKDLEDGEVREIKVTWVEPKNGEPRLEP